MTAANKPPHAEAARALAGHVNKFFRALTPEARVDAMLEYGDALKVAEPWHDAYRARSRLGGDEVAKADRSDRWRSEDVAARERKSEDARLLADGWVLIDLPKEEDER
jgi:hypothetical protein